MRVKKLAALTAARWFGRGLGGAYMNVQPLEQERIGWNRPIHESAPISAKSGPVLAALDKDRAKVERVILLLMLAGAGCLFVVGVINTNLGTTLLSLLACLACGTRIERNQRLGHYGVVPPENVN